MKTKVMRSSSLQEVKRLKYITRHGTGKQEIEDGKVLNKPRLVMFFALISLPKTYFCNTNGFILEVTTDL